MASYTESQIRTADEVAGILSAIPEPKRAVVVSLVGAFIAGMEAQKTIMPAVTAFG